MTRFLCRLVLGASLIAGFLGGPAQAAERRYAVVVGNNLGAPTDGPLFFAERDAARMADVLRQLGDVQEEDVILLRGSSRDRVMGVLDTVGRRAELDGDVSLVLFYYSGHADSAALHLGNTELGFDELAEALEALPAEVRVLVVDACRSGGLTRVKGGLPAEPFEIQADNRIEAKGTAIITSSSSGEDAQESDRLQGGVFTHHFLAGLLGAADVSGDARVTLTEAYRYGYAQTLRETSVQEVVQHPTYSFELRGKDDIVLTRLEASRNTGTLRLQDPGDYLLFENRQGGELITEVTVPAGARLSIPAGSYLLRHRNPRGIRQILLRLPAGEELAVATAEMSAVPYGTTVRKGMATERDAVLGLVLSGGMEGAPVADLGPGGIGALGLRLDLEPMSLLLRARYGQHLAGQWETLDITHHSLGLDLTAMKLVDFRRFAAGIGVRVGGDGVLQTFWTDGLAPTRQALQGRAGSLLRVEWAPAQRFVLGAEVEVDALIYPGVGPRNGEIITMTRVMPVGSMDLTWWIR